MKNPYLYTIVCRSCHKARTTQVKNKKDAIWSAKMVGWSFGKNIKCPSCNGVVPVKVGDIRYLKSNNHKVEITQVRESCYRYPIWYVDLETHIPNGCTIKDLKK